GGAARRARERRERPRRRRGPPAVPPGRGWAPARQPAASAAAASAADRAGARSSLSENTCHSRLTGSGLRPRFPTATRQGRTQITPYIYWNDGKVGTIPEARPVTRGGPARPPQN